MRIRLLPSCKELILSQGGSGPLSPGAGLGEATDPCETKASPEPSLLSPCCSLLVDLAHLSPEKRVCVCVHVQFVDDNCPKK